MKTFTPALAAISMRRLPRSSSVGPPGCVTAWKLAISMWFTVCGVFVIMKVTYWVMVVGVEPESPGARQGILHVVIVESISLDHLSP